MEESSPYPLVLSVGYEVESLLLKWAVHHGAEGGTCSLDVWVLNLPHPLPSDLKEVT